MRKAALILVCLLVTRLAPAADGPYLVKDGEGWQALTIEEAAGVPRKRAAPVAAAASIDVKAVGSLPAFTVKLRGPATAAPD